MKILKKLKDIKFYGTETPVSENIVMASAAGWYVGAICKDPDCGGMVVPYDRYSDYYATAEDVVKYRGNLLGVDIPNFLLGVA